MPIAPKWAYLDHAAVGPLSGPAFDAVQGFANQAAFEGDTVWPQWAAQIETLRADVSDMLNADSAEICMVPNTTTGINFVAEGWPWKPGDNVVIPDGEFPSNLFPWMNQASHGVELRVVPRRGEEVHVDDLIAQVDSNTRMIAVSWVGYASGFRIDIQSLVEQAHDLGVLVFLDAIQGLGMYDLDLQATPVDFLAADGHKWMLGPEGAGIAMIRREHLPRLRCGNVGWGSVKQSFNYTQPSFNLRDSAARYESGSANMVGMAALSASVKIFQRVRELHGPHAIGNRVIELSTRLHEKLDDVGITSRLPAQQNHRSGIVTFEVPGCEPAEIRRQCLAENVVVSCRGGGIRASIHAYNDDSDLDRLISVVRSNIS